MQAINSAYPPVVLEQMAEEAAFLWTLRDDAIQASHYTLSDLAKLDSRVNACLEGLAVETDRALELYLPRVPGTEPGSTFVFGVRVFESSVDGKLANALEIAASTEDAARELVSSVGWVTSEQIGKWREIGVSFSPQRHFPLVLAKMTARRADIEREIDRGLCIDSIATLSQTLKAIGEAKCRSALTSLRAHLQSDRERCRFWAAWSAILLGEKGPAESLKSFVNFNTPFAHRAIQLAPRVLDSANAQQWLRNLAQDELTRRFALIGCGVTGDPIYVPTLISQMNIPEHARVAGEAFSMITGVDLAYEDLDTDWPEGFEAGPTEDPADENVDLDPDEDLPWPNQELLQKWWNEHGRAFQPGVRYLCGQPISRENCRRVLIEGFQRQRIAAALELALLNPDEPLFEWRAPGWRQQEWLGLRKPRTPRS